MRSLLEIVTNRSDFKETVEEYESEGFSYVGSFVAPEQASTGEITLTFEGPRATVAEYSRLEGHKTFVVFEDGTTSPLYIKREKSWWED
jgi:hypothetical protein